MFRGIKSRFESAKSRFMRVWVFVKSLYECVKTWAAAKDRRYWKRFARHWSVAAILIWVGLSAGKWLGEQQYWIKLRYRIYERETRNLAHPVYNRRTTVVMVGDEEHWKGEGLAGRAPTNRSYLAKLLKAVGEAGPEVIALDIRLRAPTPDGAPVAYNNYDTENQEFIEAVKLVTKGHTTVVLPKSLGGDDSGYFLEKDVYDGLLDMNSGKIRTGYIELDDDCRKVPLDLDLKDGSKIDSFSLAIVRAAEGTPPLPSHDNNSMPYGSFMRPAEFKQYTATQVLSGDNSVLDNLAHKVVIIGGNWHSFAYNRGPWVDSFDTPVGEIAGAYVHANYVNSLMTSGVNAPLHEKVNKSIEILFSLGVATLFFLPSVRALWKLVTFISLAVIMVVISYFSWQNLGLYFDFFIPMALLFIHFPIEHWFRLREEVADLRTQVKKLSVQSAPLSV
jgi:CHASE2 domain-containing sensor protein